MNNFNNINSTINDSISDSEKHFSELNIDSHISFSQDEDITEKNRLDSFLKEGNSSNEECTALVTLKERRLLAAQTMFKKSIKISIKSFLISLSLSFLNLFI